MPFELQNVTVLRGAAPKHPTKLWRPYGHLDAPPPAIRPKERRRILFTLPGDHMLGVTTWLKTMCTCIDRALWGPVVLTDWSCDPFLIDYLENDLDVEVCTIQSSLVAAESDVGQRAAAKSRLLANWPERIDLVHNTVSSLVVEVAGLLDVPAVETVHGWAGGLKHPCKANLKAVALVSEVCWGPHINVPDVPAFLVPNGVDLSFWQSHSVVLDHNVFTKTVSVPLLRDDMSERPPSRWVALAPTSETIYVAWVGRFSTEKRPELIQDIAARTLKDDIHFYIVGAGPYDMLHALDLMPNCTTFGHLDSEEVRDILAISDFYINTSQHEGLSFATLEAMACGCYPIVAKSAGGIAEALENIDFGCVVDPPTAEGFAGALRGTEAKGDEAVKVAEEHFSAERMLGHYYDLWSGACE